LRGKHVFFFSKASRKKEIGRRTLVPSVLSNFFFPKPPRILIKFLGKEFLQELALTKKKKKNFVLTRREVRLKTSWIHTVPEESYLE